ncbi:MAG: CBS domain-containing protein [Proteobacteria bacterium]|nr:CBS domain-containing protein [Pseudomonadota bacterium]
MSHHIQSPTDLSKDSDHSGITVITTHMNADYDAIGSMLAAQKLYPDSVVVFPGSHETNLRNFFISSLVYLFNRMEPRDVESMNVRRLVIVDTKQESRLGVLHDLLDLKHREIHIYDHHPPSENDIKGSLEFYEPTGATTTILVRLIQERGILVSPDEATIMCLGIYEDTGSFTFSSTTESDFHAAAFLVSKGANLDIISNMISKEITPRQLVCLNDMIQSQTLHCINGIDIVFTSISSEEYINDFALLVHKMIQMENISVIFALGRMEDKVHVVARSRIPEVDTGQVITTLGGGGHAYAAAATVRDKTLAQVEQLIFDILEKTVQSNRTARDLMSSPPITMVPDVSCRQAARLLTRYNINSALIVKQDLIKDNILGFITRQVVEKALFHKLDETKVTEFMTSEVITAQADTGLDEIQDIIIENKQRIVPIIQGEDIIGVITRTDLLNILVQRSHLNTGKFPDPLKKPFYAKTKNIYPFMKERLSDRIIEVLRNIGQVASNLGFGVFVVGGFVRDLMLYRDNDDIDIVIEGHGIEFAKTYAKMENARINTYEKFGTAVIIFPDGFKIDVATSRMEYYRSPAALPEVEMSSIKLDLYRRDFTINTLAIRLDPNHFGTLIDFFSAQRDLKDKAIRIIHNLSFVEDPTRAFRAVKFEQRFGFTIGKLTAGLIKNAVKMDFFKRLGGLRVFSELKQILEEENPIPAIIRLFDYRLMGVIHPELSLSKELIRSLDSAKKVIAWHDLLYVDEFFERWVVYLLVMVRKYPKKISDDIAERLCFQPKYQKLFNRERFRAEGCLYWLEQHPQASNSELFRHLSPFKTELILTMMASTENEDIKKAISTFYTHLRKISISVQGRDIRDMGIPPGPLYRKILEDALDAKLNGTLNSRDDELKFIQNYV